MNIAQALKHKNRLLKKITDLQTRICLDNRYREDDKAPRANVVTLMEELDSTIEELAFLRGKIAAASVPIQPKIARLNLIKAKRIFLEKTLGVDATPTSIGYGDNAKTINYTIQIQADRKVEILSQLQEEIDSLQDEIDGHNGRTEI